MLASSASAATVNPATYGLAAGNATGNAAAINAAINAAHSGDTVSLPSGTFQVDGTLKLKAGVKLLGAGQASTTLKYDGTSLASLVSISSASNVELSGFTLDGNKSTNASQGVVASNCSGLNIHSVTVTNLVKNADGSGPHGIYCTASVTNSTLANNTLSNIGVDSVWGAGIRLAYGSSNNTVANNTVANTGRGGILCNDGSTDNTIANNTVTGSGGVGLGIEVQGCDRSLIQNNHVDHWISVDNSSGSAVRGNTISDKSGTYKLAGLELVDAHDVSFTHNTVDGGAQVGISISGPNPKRQIVFGHNTINAANTWAMQVQGDSTTGDVKNSYFFGNTFSNTLSVATGGLYANQGHGVRINGNTHYVTFDSNTITGNAGEGMQLGGGNVDDLTIVNNTITKSGDVAVDQDAMKDALWLANTVTANGPTGTWNTVPPLHAQLLPTLTISPPLLPAAGISQTFTANFVEAGGTIGAVLWDFGDGLPATTAVASHVFASAGTYEVAVTTWDQTGYAAHAEVQVTVTPEPGSLGVLAVVGLLLRRRR